MSLTIEYQLQLLGFSNRQYNSLDKAKFQTFLNLKTNINSWNRTIVKTSFTSFTYSIVSEMISRRHPKFSKSKDLE